MSGNVTKDPPQPPNSLLEDVVHDSDSAWRRWARTALLSVFVLIILAGLLGLYDMGGEKRAELGDADVVIGYPVTTRAGMDLSITVEISSDEPLPDTIRMEVDQDYLELFEDLLFVPEASEQLPLTNDIMRMEYDVPEGATTVKLTIDGRAGDEWEPRTSGTIRLYMADGSETEVPITTWRLP